MQYDIDVTVKYCDHGPKTVTEDSEVTILLGVPFQTDKGNQGQ